MPANNFLPNSGDPFPGIWSIYAQGGTVYAGGQTGFYISVDGGRHFTAYNSLEGKEDFPERVNGIVVTDGSIFAATSDGLFVSADAGQDFSRVSNGHGPYFSNTGMVAAAGSTVCSAGVGLFISPDGGKSFAQYTASSGLGGRLGNAFWTFSVAMNGNVIYCGNQNYIARLTPR